jgi:predicted PurR-regulated permease PerM
VGTRTAVRLVLVVLLTTLAVVLALWLLYRLQTIVVWSILALFLAIGLKPAVDWLERRRVPRALAILTAIGALIAIPTANIIRILVREWLEGRTASTAATTEPDVPLPE